MIYGSYGRRKKCKSKRVKLKDERGGMDQYLNDELVFR